MASKFLNLNLSRRIPIRSINRYLYSSLCTAPVQNCPETHSANPNSPEFESAIAFLKNKLHTGSLIHVLDLTSDPALATGIFKWASSQRNFGQTPETYTRIILKLGMSDHHLEMEGFLKELVRFEFPDTREALNLLISTFCKNHRVKEALRVFEITSSANIRLSLSTCNLLLGALDTEARDSHLIIFVYKEMVKAGILPDVETLNYLVKCLCDSGLLDAALGQLNRMINKRFTPNSRTSEILISALCTSGRVNEAVEILNKMLELGFNPHPTFYNSIIPLFCREDRLEVIDELLKMMRGRNLLPDMYLNGLVIECLCKNGKPDDAVRLFEQLVDSGIPPVTSMYMDIVCGYCCWGKSLCALNFLEEKNISEIEPNNALLKDICEENKITEAVNFLEKMAGRGLIDTASWNILIRELSKRGYLRNAFQVLGRMIGSSYMPDKATYSAIIVGHCELGAYGDALNRFRQAYVSDMGLDSESCSRLIEGLCFTKKIQEAFEVFYYMIGEGCTPSPYALNLFIPEVCLVGEVEEYISIRSRATCNGDLEMKRVKDTLVLLSQEYLKSCVLNVKTCCLLLRGLSSESTAREAALLFDRMVREGFFPDPETLEIFVLCMAKCSQLHMMMGSIYQVIGVLSHKVCNIVVSGLLKEGHKTEACRFLDWMLDKDWVPDAETHGLLVGSTKIGKRDGTNEVHEDEGDDKVSDILVEGLEKSPSSSCS